jgi:hypothetical protein
VEHLDRLEPEGLDSVEQPLAGPKQDGGQVERELVDHSGGERLTDGRGAARDVEANRIALYPLPTTGAARLRGAAAPSREKHHSVPAVVVGQAGESPKTEERT